MQEGCSGVDEGDDWPASLFHMHSLQTLRPSGRERAGARPLFSSKNSPGVRRTIGQGKNQKTKNDLRPYRVGFKTLFY